MIKFTASTASTAPFSRRPRPWYKRATAAFHHPQGGIPTARVIPRRIDCGPFILTFLMPSLAFGEDMGSSEPDRVDLDSSAFSVTELGSPRAHHQTIALGLSNWTYHLPRWATTRIWPVPHPPYAVITAHWQLERVKHGIQLKPDDATMLEDYLRHDYISYMESEGGPNWKIRNDAFNEKTISGDPLPQYRIDHILEHRLQSPPLDYEVVASNGLHWLRYLWEPAGMRDTLNYTTALLPDVLLTASFHITPMNSEPGADWWSLFLEDCEILVRTITCQRKALTSKE